MKMSRELLQTARDVIAFAKREGDHSIDGITPTEVARVIAVLSDYRRSVKS